MNNIAVITVFCNELFRLDRWEQYYNEYRNEVSLHVIVNNGNIEYSAILKHRFPKSIVLDCPSSNLLKAYNIGLKYVLSCDEIDAIMQITNDVQFKPGAISLMYDSLFGHEDFGIVGPTVLQKESNIIESQGVLFKGFDSYFLNRGATMHTSQDNFMLVSWIPAGVIMMKREAIEKFGFQDENINMYCDELDMAYRFQTLGYKEAIIPQAISWHQHVNYPGSSSRSTKVYYLSSRNHIYIIKKHFGIIPAILYSLKRILYESMLVLYHIFTFKFSYIPFDWIKIRGVYHGLIGNMSR